MNFVIFIIVFILGTPSLVEGEEKSQLQDSKKMDIVQNWKELSTAKAAGVARGEVSDPIRYLGKKFYVRRETKGAGGLADDGCEIDGEHPRALPSRTKLGYVWDEQFCLEGNLQFQSEGGVKYGVQAVIRF